MQPSRCHCLEASAFGSKYAFFYFRINPSIPLGNGELVQNFWPHSKLTKVTCAPYEQLVGGSWVGGRGRQRIKIGF